MSFAKRTPEQEAYRLKRLREAMSKPRNAQWLANQRAGVRHAALMGKYSQPRSPEAIEKTAAKLRGRKRPPEVVAKVAASNKGKNLFKKHTPATRAAVSKAVTETWAKLPLDHPRRKHARALGRANKGKKLHPDQGLIHSFKMKGRPRPLKAVKTSSDKMRGRPQKALLTKKGETNKKSREGVLCSPANVIYQFRNLTQFVRDHPELFLPEDVLWTTAKQYSPLLETPTPGSDTCRATKGLSSLFNCEKYRRNSWKGWRRG